VRTGVADIGSGGVGFLIKNTVLEVMDIITVNTSVDGILWMQLTNKVTKFIINICVCYLPPCNSPYCTDQQFYDDLLTLLYEYQNDGPVAIGGDFNSRIGDK
jgi:hypothetical protein